MPEIASNLYRQTTNCYRFQLLLGSTGEKRPQKIDLLCLRVLFDLFLGKDFMLVLHCLSIYSFIASLNLDLAKTRSVAALLTKSLSLQDSDKICHAATLLICYHAIHYN